MKSYKIPQYKKIFYDKKYVKDQVSLILYNYIEETYLPVRVQGDGNCLFRAISLSLFGNQNWHIELRYRTIVELFLKKAEFLKFADEFTSKHYNNNWFTYLVPCSETEPTDEYIYNQEIKLGSGLGSFSSIWHLFGAAQALKINIQQLYPKKDDPNDLGELSWIEFFNRKFNCLEGSESI